MNAANADRNAAYFGPGRGVTIYGHTADFRARVAAGSVGANALDTNDTPSLAAASKAANSADEKHAA